MVCPVKGKDFGAAVLDRSRDCETRRPADERVSCLPQQM